MAWIMYKLWVCKRNLGKEIRVRVGDDTGTSEQVDRI